jgi:hypothetical protein
MGMEYHENKLNNNISNEVKPGMKIHWMLMPAIKPRILQLSHKQKEYDFNVYGNDKFLCGNNRDHHGCLDPFDDHLLERSLTNVWNIPEP